MATPEEILDEQRRARSVRMIADLTCTVIMQTSLARAEAEALVLAARTRILELFPGREDTYELLYAPRFRRILEEFTRPESAREPGRILPFLYPRR
jgi:hypothetical protein